MTSASSYNFQLRLHKIHLKKKMGCCSKSVFVFSQIADFEDLHTNVFSYRTNWWWVCLSTESHSVLFVEHFGQLEFCTKIDSKTSYHLQSAEFTKLFCYFFKASSVFFLRPLLKKPSSFDLFCMAILSALLAST